MRDPPVRMYVEIDEAWYNQEPVGIDRLPCRPRGEILPDGRDRVTCDPHIHRAVNPVARIQHSPAMYQQIVHLDTTFPLILGYHISASRWCGARWCGARRPWRASDTFPLEYGLERV